MNKYILFMLFCFTFIFSGCSQGEEDTKKFSEIIGNEESLGYEYTVTKEQNKFSWKVGYKQDISVIEESAANTEDLSNFMDAVVGSKVAFIKLILSLVYILIVLITTVIVYKKNKKILKDAVVILTLFAGVAIINAFNVWLELSNLLKDAKYYFLILTN